jgi:glycerol-3-phosphate acyltransferase PlsX
MGGDHGPSVTVAAAVAFAHREPDVEFLLVGLESVIQAELKKNHAEHHPRMKIIHATEVVEMDDPIEIALRRKKDSSMRVAVTQVKDGHAQACVSAGNTGALMAVSRYVLKTMQSVDRPAISGMLPNQKICRPICWISVRTLIVNLCICISLRLWDRLWYLRWKARKGQVLVC